MKLFGKILNSRFFRGGAFVSLNTVSGVAFGFAQIALLGRLLPPAELGAFFIVRSTASLGAAFGSFGINQMIVRYISEHVARGEHGDAKRVIRSTTVTVVAMCFLVGMVFLTVNGFLADKTGVEFLHDQAPTIIALMLAMALEMLTPGIFRGYKEFGRMALYTQLSRVLFVGVLAVAAAMGVKYELKFVTDTLLWSTALGVVFSFVDMQVRLPGGVHSICLSMRCVNAA
ncbi:MAG: oligosaccharide flippase family protein [Myxococcales bacterium]|nr:MAG: oligosaccharide flippase family protein [Myxococcales bacterium]